jgi:hypothetical protein
VTVQMHPERGLTLQHTALMTTAHVTRAKAAPCTIRMMCVLYTSSDRAVTRSGL